jgi:hypothetical protein
MYFLHNLFLPGEIYAQWFKKERLGAKAMWRELVEANGLYELRESLTPYQAGFGPRKVDLSLEMPSIGTYLFE